jgi:hypothetical protein
MTYDPKLAFLSGACSLLSTSPFVAGSPDRLKGLPDSMSAIDAPSEIFEAFTSGADKAEILRFLSKRAELLEIEVRQTNIAYIMAYTGQVAAFALALGILIVAAWFGTRGNPVAGVAMVLMLLAIQIGSGLWMTSNHRHTVARVYSDK